MIVLTRKSTMREANGLKRSQAGQAVWSILLRYVYAGTHDVPLISYSYRSRTEMMSGDMAQ